MQIESVVFEEINHDLRLRFRRSLSTGEPFGLIRHCSLENTGLAPVTAATSFDGEVFRFEGLGSIDWPMIAKLLLAMQENDLTEVHADIRNRLGFRKPPAVDGAFPTAPYSHTPAQHGAQQPGMTGQVKAERLRVLTNRAQFVRLPA